MSKTLEDFDVEEQPSNILEEKYPNLKVIHSAVRGLHAKQHVSQMIVCVCVLYLSWVANCNCLCKVCMYMTSALDRYRIYY